MLLEEHAAVGPLMTKAFTVFAVFWVAVLVILYFGVGILLRRAERKGHGGHAGH